MDKTAAIMAALIVGMAQAVQGVINSGLSRHVGQVRAVSISLLGSVITIALLLLLWPGPGSYAAAGHAPRWNLIGGIFGVVVLMGTIIALPRIGVAATTGVIVATQVLTSALIDRFGLLGAAVRPLSPGRLSGLALLVVAVIIVVRT